MTGSTDLMHEYAAWLGNEPGSPAATPLTEALDRLFGAAPDQATLSAAQRRVARMLAQERSASAYYAKYHHPLVGPLFLAASDAGLVALNFGVSEPEFIDQLLKLGFRPRPDGEQLAVVAGQVSEYLDGRREGFEVQVDLSHLTEFQRAVLRAAMSIPRGQVATYGRIAQQIGKPRAARAVGQALGRNPIPIVIPCHRVVASDGGLQGYSGGGGVRTKARLLALEGAHLQDV